MTDEDCNNNGCTMHQLCFPHLVTEHSFCSLSDFYGGGGGGSSVGGSGVGGGSSFTGGGAQGGLFEQNRDVSGEFVVKGQDLVYVLGQANNRINKG